MRRGIEGGGADASAGGCVSSRGVVARDVGIRNISFDLIAGLPGQTDDSWRESLEELGQLEPEHVSVYLLEVDEGSRLGLEILRNGKRYRRGAVPSEDEMAEFYETACAFLEERGVSPL